jgi:hypothetical protein
MTPLGCKTGSRQCIVFEFASFPVVQGTTTYPSENTDPIGNLFEFS